MRKCIVVMGLTVAVIACGCQTVDKTVNLVKERVTGKGHTPQPGEATNFGVAKGRRQVSTWFTTGDWKAIEPYADIISSISMFGGASKELIEKCHEADIEVYLPVAGDERAVFAFDTPEHAQATVQQLVKRCEELGADGIDLDYECFECEWQERYTAFIVALADELHRRDMKLSICVNVLMPGPDTSAR